MERYEFVDGTSSKFWEIAVEGTELTVRFGRIGTNGQDKAKSFADGAAAQKEYEKLVREKTGKGYALVTGSAAAPTPPAVSSPPSPSSSPPPPSSSPRRRGSRASPASPEKEEALDSRLRGNDEQATLIEPHGGFLWTDALRAELPVVRGVHVPASLRIPRANTPMPEFPGMRPPPKEASGWPKWMASALATGQEPAHWGVETCVAQHGLKFALQVVVPLCKGRQHSDRWILDPMREAIAAADDAGYQAAFAEALAMRKGAATRGNQAAADALALTLSYLFAHVAEWADEFLERHDDKLDWLGSCAVSAERFNACMQVHPSGSRQTLLLQAALHDLAAFETFGLAYELMVHYQHPKEWITAHVDLLRRMRGPALLPALLMYIDRKDIRDALDRLAEEFPAAVLRDVIGHCMGQRDTALQGWMLRLAQRHPQAVAPALDALPVATRRRFEALQPVRTVPQAQASELPAILREPPWLQGGKRPPPLPELQLAVHPLPDHIAWTGQELASARSYELPKYHKDNLDYHLKADTFSVSAAGLRRLAAGEPLQEGDLRHEVRLEWLFLLPAPVRLPLWNSVPPDRWVWGDLKEPVERLLADYGVAALPALADLLAAHTEKLLPLIARIDSQRFVPVVLRAFRQLKKMRGDAQHWMLGHVPTILSMALPAAFARGPAAARDDARHAIAWLVAQGFQAEVKAAAAFYGTSLAQAVDQLLAEDPLLATPTKLPAMPAFFVPTAMHRPVLRSGTALPTEAVQHLGTMLAISELSQPYAGIAQVKAVCTPDSLAAFAWDLYEAWLTAGAPPKEGWAFTALGLLGDDECARRLAPRIREWPGEGFQARAVIGLDILAAIGSDIALMHLNGMALKLRYKPLQERARQRIATVAAARNLSPEELADRLVPDLGLDESGSTVLDFGPRQFTVGFDEMLKPFVRDAGGQRLRDLPKPAKGDDADKAAAATERLRQIRKDAKAAASIELVRLELGMVDRRRWRAAEFRACFLQHPLMRHLAARLAWGVYRDGRLAHCFRVAEDWTLADAQDQRCELPDDAVVGVCHVLEMDSATQAAFGQLFADYEILQPFKQLGRETYALTASEAKARSLTRFATRPVTSGGLMSLVNRGWRKDEAESGCVSWLLRPLPGGLEAWLQLEPGLRVGEFDAAEAQHLPEMILQSADAQWDASPQPFGCLDPIVASELLRDIDLLESA